MNKSSFHVHVDGRVIMDFSGEASHEFPHIHDFALDFVLPAAERDALNAHEQQTRCHEPFIDRIKLGDMPAFCCVGITVHKAQHRHLAP